MRQTARCFAIVGLAIGWIVPVLAAEPTTTTAEKGSTNETKVVKSDSPKGEADVFSEKQKAELLAFHKRQKNENDALRKKQEAETQSFRDVLKAESKALASRQELEDRAFRDKQKAECQVFSKRQEAKLKAEPKKANPEAKNTKDDDSDEAE
jgi:hypothetical protein